jgi:sugar porter (SP) family MFS transporter
MDEAQFAVVSSIFTLGGLIGALSAGPVSTSYGRLLAMRTTSTFFVVGGILEATAGHIPMMSVGRVLSGVGAGAATVVVPLYISEVAPPREKGLFGAFTQITTNVGILFAQTLGFFLSKGSMWRIILAVGGCLGLAQGLGLFFIPESPSWTASHQDPQKAVNILQRIRGRHTRIDEEIQNWDVDTTAIRQPEEEGLLSAPQVRRTSSNSKLNRSVTHVGMLEVARNPDYRPALVAVVGVMFAQQLCGINSIIMYSVSLLSTILPTSAALITILISVVNLVTTTLCAPLADKLGRKASILLSIAGMGSMSLALALSILFEIKVLSAISALLFVAAFGVGLGPVPFILASELVDQEAAGALQSWSLGANWIATFLVAQFFPIINAKLGGQGKVYFIFAALALFWGIFIAWRVPETKGKKDADEVWGRTRRDD